ncbi:hypothetical protein [Microvirga sp. 2TAF3]|uniref:hypothetical protein n=1 Tax=Microvirga sp. 2TAF3 TaxID=3233014 RepID=UPI003F9DA1F6
MTPSPFGLAIQIVRGPVLLAAEETHLGVNPAFYAKLVFIAVGRVNVRHLSARFGGALWTGSLTGTAWPSAFVSLATRILGLGARRMIAYL